MRIAFTSCFSAQLFPDQPVWNEIAATNPDVLLLLGDSIYLDVGGPYNSSGVQGLTAYEFALHAQSRYEAQLKQSQFSALVRKPSVTTYAIWDDHDFLWNNACGADVMRNKALRPLVYESRAMFAAYCNALTKRLAPGSFPFGPTNANSNTPAPGYMSVDLGNRVFLHLTDGRSFRKGRGRDALLGTAQLDAMEAAMALAPADASHLLASGSVFDARHGENWLNCRDEYERMQTLAAKYNIMILSGDIHDNNLASYTIAGGRSLFEATASGAAVRTGVVIGAMQRNYGLLTIDDSIVGIDLFKSGASQYRGTINRATWK